MDLQAQRMLCAVALWCPQNLEKVIAALYHISFVERKAIHTPEALQPVLADVIGKEDAADLIAKVCSINGKSP